MNRTGIQSPVDTALAEVRDDVAAILASEAGQEILIERQRVRDARRAELAHQLAVIERGAVDREAAANRDLAAAEATWRATPGTETSVAYQAALQAVQAAAIGGRGPMAPIRVELRALAEPEALAFADWLRDEHDRTRGIRVRITHTGQPVGENESEDLKPIELVVEEFPGGRNPITLAHQKNIESNTAEITARLAAIGSLRNYNALDDALVYTPKSRAEILAEIERMRATIPDVGEFKWQRAHSLADRLHLTGQERRDAAVAARQRPLGAA